MWKSHNIFSVISSIPENTQMCGAVNGWKKTVEVNWFSRFTYKRMRMDEKYELNTRGRIFRKKKFFFISLYFIKVCIRCWICIHTHHHQFEWTMTTGTLESPSTLRPKSEKNSWASGDYKRWEKMERNKPEGKIVF